MNYKPFKHNPLNHKKFALAWEIACLMDRLNDALDQAVKTEGKAAPKATCALKVLQALQTVEQMGILAEPLILAQWDGSEHRDPQTVVWMERAGSTFQIMYANPVRGEQKQEFEVADLKAKHCTPGAVKDLILTVIPAEFHENIKIFI